MPKMALLSETTSWAKYDKRTTSLAVVKRQMEGAWLVSFAKTPADAKLGGCNIVIATLLARDTRGYVLSFL